MKEQTLIAVVDDDPMWLATAGRMLSRDGYHVLLIGDPLEAPEQIADERPAVVILDLAMPGLNGVQLARALLRDLGERTPPMVLISGDLSELGREDGALFEAAYEKPVSLQQLLSEVRRLVRGQKISGVLSRDDVMSAGEDTGS